MKPLSSLCNLHDVYFIKIHDVAFHEPQQLFQEKGMYTCTRDGFRFSRVRQRQGFEMRSPACGFEKLRGCDRVWKQIMVGGERHVGSCDHFTC